MAQCKATLYHTPPSQGLTISRVWYTLAEVEERACARPLHHTKYSTAVLSVSCNKKTFQSSAKNVAMTKACHGSPLNLKFAASPQSVSGLNLEPV